MQLTCVCKSLSAASLKSYDRPITSQWPIPAHGYPIMYQRYIFSDPWRNLLRVSNCPQGGLSLFVSNYHLHTPLCFNPLPLQVMTNCGLFLLSLVPYLKNYKTTHYLQLKGEHLPADQATKGFSQKGNTKQCGKNKQDQNGTHLCCVQKMKRTERNPSVSQFLT